MDLPRFPRKINGDPDEVAKAHGMGNSGTMSFRIWCLWGMWPVDLGPMEVRRAIEMGMNARDGDLWDCFMDYLWPVPFTDVQEWFNWAKPYIVGDEVGLL